ncbi:ATP-dependent DNA ligase [Phycicoccus sp. HDW14]|uniref:ATP-dependent DNA ligase n=1 Tax=Phycicoccus sp. HDW14 TaxID=2714941 RepID=UPI00352FEEF7
MTVALADLVAVSAEVAATRSRTAKTAALAGLLARADADEVGTVVAFLSGVLPQRRLGIGYRSLTSLPDPAVEPSLTVAEVDAAFDRLAGSAGAGSTASRRAELAGLMGRATADEQAFLRALMTGNLRQGALDGVVLGAVAAAFEVPDAVVRRAVMLAGSTHVVAGLAASGGQPALEEVGLVVGRPLRPMLAASAKTTDEAVEGFAGADMLVDGKLDGIRVQVHRRDGEVTVFTRSLDEITERVPEVVEAVDALPGGDLVLDGEAIVLREGGRPAPFQVTGARTASSADVERLRAEVPLTTFLFDVLHADGRDLVDASALERHEVLTALAPHLVVPRLLTADPAEAAAFFDALVAAGHEGVVVKDAASPYAAGRRGSGWVKVKPTHTLDLVVLAVERGSGRRRGWLSNIHLGARDPDGDGYVMVGKTFKGMTDEMLRWQTERFTELADGPTDGYVVTVRPEQVVEIALDGVQRSSRYPGAWRCGSRGSCATATTSRSTRSTPSTRSARSAVPDQRRAEPTGGRHARHRVGGLEHDGGRVSRHRVVGRSAARWGAPRPGPTRPGARGRRAAARARRRCR